MEAKDYKQDNIPILDSPVTDTDILSIKLRQEILHLERWLETQKRPNRNQTSSVASTIEELIRTRKKLLDSLATQET